MSKSYKMQIKFDRGVKINRDLFVFITGLNDERNNQKKLREYMDKAFSQDGFISCDDAWCLVNDLTDTGKFWMYNDIPGDIYETGLYRRIMEFVDACDITGIYNVSWI